MSIQGLGSYNSSPSAYSPPQSSPSGSSSQPESVQQQFLDYMKESPEQRAIDAWLKAHHLTQADLDKMPSQQRDAIMKELADEIKNKVQQQAEAKQSTGVNILA